MSKNPRMQHQAFMALIKTLNKNEISALVEEMDGDSRDTLLEKLRTYDAIMNPQNYVDHHSAQKRSR